MTEEQALMPSASVFDAAGTAFVAGSRAEIPRVLAAVQVAAAAGFPTACAWWLRVRAVASEGDEAHVPSQYMEESLFLNTAALRYASVLIVLAQAYGKLSAGTASDLGYFLAYADMDRAGRHGYISPRKRKVFLLGAHPTLWAHHPEIVRVSDLADLGAALRAHTPQRTHSQRKTHLVDTGHEDES